MGVNKQHRPLQVPGLRIGRTAVASVNSTMGAANIDLTIPAATNGVRFGRLVVVKTDGSIIPTTGSSGRMGIGITLTSGASGASVPVRVWGVCNAVASTGAITKGRWLRGTSGPSTGANAGTVKATTGIVASCVGISLTTVAAAAVSTARTVRVLILHPGQVLQ